MADKKPKKKKSTPVPRTIDLDIPSVRVVTSKQQPIKDDPKPVEKPRMKVGEEPPGTGHGGVAPPEETKWKPGTSPNPGGRPKDPPGMREMKLLTKYELVKVGNMIINHNLGQLKEFVEDPETPALQVMVASVVSRIIRTGDMNMLNTLLDRLIGKVKEEFTGSLNHSGQVSVGGRTLVSLPANGREAKK